MCLRMNLGAKIETSLKFSRIHEKFHKFDHKKYSEIIAGNSAKIPYFMFLGL